jgi:outer membrane scaffolding protein for murein synthesis (MipA/OmpV family)
LRIKTVRRRGLALAALTLLACGSSRTLAASADNNAHFDLGIGLTALSFPDYPGASSARTFLLPFPYIVYSNRFLDVDRDRVRGKVLAGTRLSLDVDFAGSVAVDSSRNPERKGMPNLDWIGEAGPALRYRFWDGGDGRHLDAVLPIRSAVSFHVLTLHRRGWVLAPRLEFESEQARDGYRYGWTVTAGADYADSDYHRYVYGVDSQYATLERPAYSPAGGYGGFHVAIGFSIRHGNLWYGAFCRYVDLQHATFSESPLVSRQNYITAGAAVAWIIRSSD